MGFNSYTQTMCIDNAVKVMGTENRTPSGKSQSVTYNSKVVEKLSDIVNTMNISYSSSIKRGTVEVGGSTDTINEDKIYESDLNAVISVKVVNQTTIIEEDPEFMPIDEIRLGSQNFDEVYGDCYISGFIEGGEFNGIFSMRVLDRSQVGTVATTLKKSLSSGSGKDFSLDLDLFKTGTSANNHMKDTETTISVSWTGGGQIKDPQVDWDLDSVRAAAAAFPGRVAEVPQKTWAILTKYKANRSFQKLLAKNFFTPLEYDAVASYTAELFENYMAYKQLVKLVQDMITYPQNYEVQVRPEEYVISLNLKQLVAVKTALRREMNKIVKAVDVLAKDPDSLRRNADKPYELHNGEYLLSTDPTVAGFISENLRVFGVKDREESPETPNTDPPTDAKHDAPAGTNDAPPAGATDAPPAGTNDAPPAGTNDAPPAGANDTVTTDTNEAPSTNTNGSVTTKTDDNVSATTEKAIPKAESKDIPSITKPIAMTTMSLADEVDDEDHAPIKKHTGKTHRPKKYTTPKAPLPMEQPTEPPPTLPEQPTTSQTTQSPPIPPKTPQTDQSKVQDYDFSLLMAPEIWADVLPIPKKDKSKSSTSSTAGPAWRFAPSDHSLIDPTNTDGSALISAGALDSLSDVHMTRPAKNSVGSLTVSFPQPYASPPRMCYGLNTIDLAPDTTVCSSSFEVLDTSISREAFTATARSTNDCNLNQLGMSWLALPEKDFHMEAGTLTVYNGSISEIPVMFKKRFSAAPKVVCWISGVDLASGLYALETSVSEVWSDGCKILVKVPAGVSQRFNSVNIGWFAYDTTEDGNRVKVTTATLEGGSEGPGGKPTGDSSVEARELFKGNGAFGVTPAMFCAISKFAFQLGSQGQSVSVSYKELTATSFIWRIGANVSSQGGTAAVFIAIEP